MRQIAILVQPYMPASGAKLLDALGVAEAERGFSSLGDARRLNPGNAIPKPQGVFPRYVEIEN